MTPDRVATAATATGIGLLVVMVTWIVAARVATVLWPSPGGYVAALSAAAIAGTAATVTASRRLHRTIHGRDDAHVELRSFPSGAGLTRDLLSTRTRR